MSPAGRYSPRITRQLSGSVLALLCLAAFLVSGCQPRSTRIRIQDFLHPQAPRSLYQEFDEAYYQLDAAGSLQLVLRRQVPSEAIPTENITQIILVKTYWRPIPGRTYAESTMINAKLTYLIQSGRACRAYQGNGFVSFTEDRKGQTLSGRIESANLKPTGEMGHPPHPFGKAQLEGTFRALRKPRRATAVLTDLTRTMQKLRPLEE